MLRAVVAAVADRFPEVPGADTVATVEIRDGARHAQDAMVRAGR